MLSCPSWLRLKCSPLNPKPALLTSMSISPVSLIKFSTPTCSDRSDTTTFTSIECLSVNSFARDSSSAFLLAVITRSQPCEPNTLAISRPIPLDAPVTKAFSF